MILGKSGKLPGELAPEIIELAKSKGYEFTDENPQDNFPDALETYKKEMDDNGWEYGPDNEELFELAMHVIASICPPRVIVIKPMCPPCSEANLQMYIFTKANNVLSVAAGSPSLRIRKV